MVVQTLRVDDTSSVSPYIKLKEDWTHPIPLSVSRSLTPLLVIIYTTTIPHMRKQLNKISQSAYLPSKIRTYYGGIYRDRDLTP